MELSNLEHSDFCYYCADHDILCSFADGSLCPPLHGVLHRTECLEAHFPHGDKDTLVSGTTHTIFLFRFKMKQFNKVSQLCQSRSSLLLSATAFLFFPLFLFWSGYLHPICSITVPHNIHSHSFVVGIS